MSTLAERQLAAWQDIAKDWPVDLGEDGVARCHECGKGVLLWMDSKKHGYVYSDDQIRALVVLHLRNHHPDLDPDR